MTKLLEWLAVFGVFASIWAYLVKTKEQSDANYNLVLFSPIIFIGLFGVYAATVVLYRVLTFNDCEEAAEELKSEIQEAKAALFKNGFKFKESQS